ncbi:hypothetical protein GCM10007147_33640 [Nocardiopsis kunsanensis]|uniref:Mannose-1-phosphate guanylyltransferase (GDP) n=1 Tax=Nocardiopsis kunsanensis TaxID=141693 RepID=A0A918XGE7_9ACTN|nr:hypothetical protein [Nocardiopsis kunsanensis]GHD31110.1 hypothetical protein GCM10007147_33640 [Nocardiopsis kunsanensis]
MGEPDETGHYAPWLTEESKDPADRNADGTHTSGTGAAEDRPRKGDDGPDVLLDVPHLNVDEIDLEVDELRARVALQARVLDLLQLDVGADVDLSGVRLDIKGVQAQALLKVRLDNVESIIGRVLQTIDENPQIVEAAARTVADTAGKAADDLGRTAEGVTEGVGKAAEGVGGVAEGAGRAAEGAAGSAGAVARDLGDSADIADTAPGTGGGQNAGVEKRSRDPEPENSGEGAVPGMRTAVEQTESPGAASPAEPVTGRETTDVERSGKAAGTGRHDDGPGGDQAGNEGPEAGSEQAGNEGPEAGSEQAGNEGPEAGGETDGTEPEAAVERPEDRTTDDRPEGESGTEQAEDEAGSDQAGAEDPGAEGAGSGADGGTVAEKSDDESDTDRTEDDDTGQPDDESDTERWERARAEAGQALSAARERVLKGLGAGAKQLGRELGGAASRVVRAAREGE